MITVTIEVPPPPVLATARCVVPTRKMPVSRDCVPIVLGWLTGAGPATRVQVWPSGDQNTPRFPGRGTLSTMLASEANDGSGVFCGLYTTVIR